MRIEYRTNKLQKTLEDEKALVRSFGSLNAKKIMARLGQVQAFPSLADLPVGRPHPHKGDRDGLFSLDIKHPLRLIIRPIGIFDYEDYSTITEVEIYEIMDPH